MVKVFTTNSDGKIELTKNELEKLLNEAWEGGRSYCYPGPWSSKSDDKVITTPLYINKGAKITCDTANEIEDLYD